MCLLAKKVETGLDPVLARRMKQQAEKNETGASAVEHCGRQSVISQKMDPVLERRMRQQQQKLETGDASAVEHVGSAADTRAKFDPKLQIRLSQQHEKVITGESASGLEDVASPVRRRRASLAASPCELAGSELAERLSRRRASEEAADPEVPCADGLAAEPLADEPLAAAEALPAMVSNPPPMAGRSALCRRRRTQQVSREGVDEDGCDGRVFGLADFTLPVLGVAALVDACRRLPTLVGFFR